MNQRDKDLIPNWPFNATRIELLGTKGFLYVCRHGDGWQLFDETAKLIETSTGRQGDALHIENFLQAVRSARNGRRRGTRPPVRPPQPPREHRLPRRQSDAHFRRPTETFPVRPEANQFLKRPHYREPWVVPEEV